MANRDPESRGMTKNRGNNGYQSNYYSPGYHVDSTETQWTSWLVPMIVVANVAMFFVIMFVNDCPKNNFGGKGACVVKFLGRLSFQPLRENPLFGPSSSA